MRYPWINCEIWWWWGERGGRYSSGFRQIFKDDMNGFPPSRIFASWTKNLRFAKRSDASPGFDRFSVSQCPSDTDSTLRKSWVMQQNRREWVTLAVSLTGGHNVPICGQLHNAKKACKRETEGIPDKVAIQQPDKDNNTEMINTVHAEAACSAIVSCQFGGCACWIFTRHCRIIRSRQLNLSYNQKEKINYFRHNFKRK